MGIRISYSRLSGYNGADQFVGGVETYLMQLGECFADVGIRPILYQCARVPFERQMGLIDVVGIKTPDTARSTANARFVGARLVSEARKSGDVAIFASDEWSLRTSYSRALSINHGISLDKPSQYLETRPILQKSGSEVLKRAWLWWRELRHSGNCRNKVCVDYNYLNWYRTIRTVDPSWRIWVIPNSSPRVTPAMLAAREGRNDGQVRILFARRFEPYRGTRLMAEVTVRILKRYPNLQVTFAGEGSDGQWLRDRFIHESRVAIHKIQYEERMACYLAHDIAVTPSYGSEGTSLSVLEAMAAGCAVVASNVGGITQIVINGYNGILVDPSEQAFETALTKVIEDGAYRKTLGMTAHETATRAFGLERWKAQWREVLRTVSALPI